MARNLSKISAVISVNTQEARQQLAGFAGDATKYAKSLDTSFSNTTKRIQGSFENIWTAQEKVKRALQAGIQAGVNPKTLRLFGDTKKMEEEAGRIIELRKKAMGMMTQEGQAAANKDISKVAEAFARLNDELIRTGSISKKALKALHDGITLAGGSVGIIGKKDARLGTSRQLLREFDTKGTDRFFDEKRLSVAVRQMEAYRRIIGQLGAEANGPIRQAFNNLTKAQARMAKIDPVDKSKLAAAKAEVERLRVEFEKLAAAKARADGGHSRNLRTVAGIRNQVDQAAEGSINSQWGTRAGLAIQQLTFAFDDFNSATGGMDAKIRAMGNNISQFGLIAGGTAGLIGGVLVGAMAQLYASYLKHVDALNDSAAVTKIVAEEENRLTAARQKQLDVIKDIANALQGAGLTEGQKRELAANKEAEDFKAAAEQEARANVGIADPELRRLRARNAQIEQELANPDTSLARRRQLQQEQRGLQPRISAREEQLLQRESVTATQLFDGFVREFNGIIEAGGEFSGMWELSGQLDNLIALRDQIPAEMFDAMVAEFLERFAAENQNLRGTFTAGRLFNQGERAATLGQNRDAREAWLRSQGIGEMIPTFRSAENELNRVGGVVDSVFGDAIPEQYLATMEDIHDEMNLVWEQLTSGAINAEQAAAEMERLNGELQNVSASARQAAADAEGERRGRSLLADMQIDAFNREQEAKKRFFNESDMFATERGMQSVRQFNLGARQTDGVTDEQAAEETLGMVMREFAPAILQLANARENAMLQGASRSPLQMQDISTAAGASEYARLVSGNDSAKDANIVELRRQSQLLGELVRQGEAEGIF